MITLYVSRGIGKNLNWIRYTRSGVNSRNIAQNKYRLPLMMVHQMKKFVSVAISNIVSLLFRNQIKVASEQACHYFDLSVDR